MTGDSAPDRNILRRATRRQRPLLRLELSGMAQQVKVIARHPGVLLEGDLHGYGMMQAVAQESRGKVHPWMSLTKERFSFAVAGC